MLKDILKPQATSWMTTVDLKDAYFTIPMTPNHRCHACHNSGGKEQLISSAASLSVCRQHLESYSELSHYGNQTTWLDKDTIGHKKLQELDAPHDQALMLSCLPGKCLHHRLGSDLSGNSYWSYM